MTGAEVRAVEQDILTAAKDDTAPLLAEAGWLWHGPRMVAASDWALVLTESGLLARTGNRYVISGAGREYLGALVRGAS